MSITTISVAHLVHIADANRCTDIETAAYELGRVSATFHVSHEAGLAALPLLKRRVLDRIARQVQQ